MSNRLAAFARSYNAMLFRGAFDADREYVRGGDPDHPGRFSKAPGSGGKKQKSAIKRAGEKTKALRKVQGQKYSGGVAAASEWLRRNGGETSAGHRELTPDQIVGLKASAKELLGMLRNAGHPQVSETKVAAPANESGWTDQRVDNLKKLWAEHIASPEAAPAAKIKMSAEPKPKASKAASAHFPIEGALPKPAKPKQPKALPDMERDEHGNPRPAVAIKKSVTPDYLISLIDGKKYKQLKRGLAAYGLSPEQYRKMFALPADYPMVAPKHTAEAKRDAKRHDEWLASMQSKKKPIAKDLSVHQAAHIAAEIL